MQKPKIGIITILKVNNYGAELQAYALQRKLVLMGYDAEVIDYLFGINPKHDSRGEVLDVPLSFKTKLKTKLLPHIQNFLDLLYPRTRKKRKSRFDSFHSQFTKLSNRTFHSVKSLYDVELNYDVYCVGSDQVWNYQKGYSIRPFLLDFVPSGKIKMSFASSIGLSELTDSAKKLFKKHLGMFDHIAVREAQAAQLLTPLINKQIPVVLDPTLMLSVGDWRKVANYEMCPNVPYLLLYIVTIKPCTYAIRLAEHIAKERNLKIVRLYRSAATYEAKSNMINLPGAGPSEFVGLIEKASFVVTNSFHGTVFSINFEIPFYCVVKKGKDTNSRLQSILEMLRLSDRISVIGSSFPNESSWDCNFKDPTMILKEKRTQSEEYLRNSLHDNYQKTS